MIQFGTVKPGSTLEIEAESFNSSGASVTLTGLAVTDIEVYKDGSVTQRASDSGYTLLDTDGIDFDGITGIHGFSISLADNTTAGFWAAGSRYTVVVSAVTVDSQTVNFIGAKFRIGYPGAILDTTIATLASQTSFTLTAGPAEDNALNGCVCVVHDVASAVQVAIGVVLDYTGATKTVTLGADPAIFTMATTDNISFFSPVGVNAVNGGAISGSGTPDVNVVQISGDTTAADNAEAMFDGTGYVGGTIKLGVDAVAISGDTTAADNAEVWFNDDKPFIRLVVASATNTTTFVVTTSVDTPNNTFNNMQATLIRKSVSNATPERQRVSDFTNINTTSGTVLLASGFTSAPAANDIIIIQ